MPASLQLVLTGLTFPAPLQRFIEDLNPHYLPPRYPDFAFAPAFSFTYNHNNVAKIIQHAQQVQVWLNNFLMSNQ